MGACVSKKITVGRGTVMLKGIFTMVSIDVVQIYSNEYGLNEESNGYQINMIIWFYSSNEWF